MAGQRIKNTKETLQIFLNSLPTNCLFNVVAFSHRHDMLFASAKPYNNESLAQAQLFVENLKASGGTQIYRPLREILTSKPIEGYPRQVFLLTDGEVGDTDRIVRMAGENAVSTRIFSFGIGRGASLPLCKGLARKSRGMFEMIVDSDKITEQVMRIITSALQPPLCNAVVDWGGSVKALHNVENKEKQSKSASFQVPSCPPPIYPGRQFIYATNVRVSNAEGGAAKNAITIASSHNKEEEKLVLDLSGVKPHRGTLLHVLAAKSRIRELEERAPKPLSKQQRDEIRALGLRFNLASSETSFVAVLEKEEDANAGARSETPTDRTEQHVVPVVGGGGGRLMASLSTPQPLPTAAAAAAPPPSLGLAQRSLEAKIQNVLARGESLELLDNMAAKADDLAENANTFLAKSKKKSSMFGGLLSAISRPFGGGLMGRKKSLANERTEVRRAQRERGRKDGDLLAAECEGREEDHDSSSSSSSSDDDDDARDEAARARPVGGKKKKNKKQKKKAKDSVDVRALKDNDSAFQSLLRAQHSNGGWALDSKLCRVLDFFTKTNQDEKELVAACKKALSGQGVDAPSDQSKLEAVAATLLALAILSER
mmetsp:Transcript_15291/g.24412  ORF Transcript_15291/g.24412 Transcript_15291/m.24412 type:complete len:599 (+) Transcript_15291:1080-2876(+)